MEPARMDDKTAQLLLGPSGDSREDLAMECSVCMLAFDEEFKRPRTLPCGHTFCTPCVNGLKEQCHVTCPNCRVVHAVPEVGQFPISYDFENLIRRIRRTFLAFPPPNAEKETAESAHSPETRPGEKGQQGLSKRVRSLLEEQEAKILAAIHSCQKVKAQLNQYETTARDWGREQQVLEDCLQALMDQCKDARMLARQEELSASDKRQQVDHGEHQLHTLLQAIRTAASGVEAYKTIEASDHVMEEETQREEECLARLPDVHTVTTLNKATEVAQAALEAAATVQAAQQTADVGGGAAGDASLPVAAAASSIRDRVDALMSPPLRSLQVEDLRSLTQHVRDLLQRGLVFAVHTTAGRSRQASLSLEDDRLYLHCLRDQPLPRGAVTLQLDEVAAAAPPCRVFLELGWNGRPSRRVLIHLDTDHPRARQFLLLCTGQRGPSYNGSGLLQVWNEGRPGEFVVGGDYERKNGKGGAALLPDLDKGEHRGSRMAGVVCGRSGVPARGAQFCIITEDLPGQSVSYVIGKVEGGLDVVREAIRHHPITEVTVVDCGVVVD